MVPPLHPPPPPTHTHTHCLPYGARAGTDGCSAAQLAVLKRTSLAPSNSFVAPTTYVLEQVVDAQLVGLPAAQVCQQPRFASRAYLAPVLQVASRGALASAQRAATWRRLLPGNTMTYPGPHVQASTYLYSDEATVLLPAENETSSDGEPGSGELGSTGPWLGCIVARGALLGGEVVATLSGVATPEECCRRCREREAANVWNFCDRLDGCR